jgi:E3 ubiquitin-protein ligase RGLG
MNKHGRNIHFMQFVNFTEIMSKSVAADRKEAEFALSALMEIPTQYKATLDLQLLGYLI